MKLGILQGRLLPPVDNKIQEFPTNWEDEFQLIDSIGLNHIEFIITNKSFNQFKNISLEKYKKNISGICCDHIIDSNFFR
jgi:hypothetical protein